MRAAWLMVAVVACGGDGDGDDSGGTAGTNPLTTPGGGGGGGGIDCDGVPSYDWQGMDCDEWGSAWQDLINATSACGDKADCRLVRPECEDMNQVQCWYAANECLGSDVVADFNSISTGCLGDQGYCVCGPQPVVDCLNGRCEVVPSTY